MLVDLGRNDLGRVCRFGSVSVPEFMKVERYSHVAHIVSSVTGELAPGKDALDALAATFPAAALKRIHWYPPFPPALEEIEGRVLERIRSGS